MSSIKFIDYLVTEHTNINEAKRLTKEYARKNQCFATFDIEHHYKTDNYEDIIYRFYSEDLDMALTETSLLGLIKQLKELS